MAVLDPWRELGVPRGASEADIKAAYRALVLQFHPDRHASASVHDREAAAARFRAATQAYDTLTDERARLELQRQGGGMHRSGGRTSTSWQHAGVNTDWAHTSSSGGYTSRLSVWEVYRRAAVHGVRGLGHSLHIGLALLLVGGGLLFEQSHTALWHARNQGKSFEDMQQRVAAARVRSSGERSDGGGTATGSKEPV